MKVHVKKIARGLGLIAALLFVFVSGACSGYVVGIKQMSEWLSKVPAYDELVALDIKDEIINLKYLRAGEINASIDRLEFLLENNIDYFGNRLRNTKYTLQQKKKIIESLKEAKKYREQYPYYKPKFKIENAFGEISGE